ncbi:Dyp-type peroxidase domain-containing protein [Hymenobacter cellulosilyticus]|uniref:Dyp-type peroxidase n=1 Tax=Hymenobacter cellulosilyticus TaxID=2932248 RepID=A0A8T9QBP7_9BACT|nr:Dyp-type peroxidase domain-containing protein [Hymenobacter cellulosilyticus]UOQ73548.1 Dyp-type peroxidase [Hymenobacter cellulosilyticus]
MPFPCPHPQDEPTGETNNAAELRHRITRRGIPYGSRKGAQQGEDAGLLFMCYQRNIGQQFEFLQKSWANNERFLFDKGLVGLDPIIGQGKRAELTFPTAWNRSTKATAHFAQFVTMRGGEYFYAPSLSGLAALAQSPAEAV